MVRRARGGQEKRCDVGWHALCSAAAMPLSLAHLLTGLDRRTRPRRWLWWWISMGVVVWLGWSAMTIRTVCACIPKTKAAATDAVWIVRAVQVYKGQHERCPRSGAEMVAARVITRVPRDPWRRDYVVACADASAHVCSLGAEVASREDDICVDSSIPGLPGWER